jgi:hypothetical protein
MNSTLLAKNTSAELFYCTGTAEEAFLYVEEQLAFYGNFSALGEAFFVNLAGVAIESQ